MSDSPRANSGWHVQRARFPWVTLTGYAALALGVFAALLFAGNGVGWPNTQSLLAGLSGLAEVMVAILAIAVTVVAIVVELAATRYGPRVVSSFLREPINRWVLALFALTTLLCASLFFVGDLEETRLTQLLLLLVALFVAASILLLVPYFTFVLSFISPVNLIGRMQHQGSRLIRQAAGSQTNQGARRALSLVVEDLRDMSRSAIEQADRSIGGDSVDAIFVLLQDYLDHRDQFSDVWFELNDELIDDPDFVSLEDSSLTDLREHGLWFELKVLRHLASIMGHSVPRMRDLANLIAIRTRALGARSASSSPGVLRLVTNAFNSYLRITINAKDLRTSYYLLHQYRALAEELIDLDQGSTSSEIAGHFRYYGQLAYQLDQQFLLEVCAYDLVHLIRHAQRANDPCATHLLGVLLELDLEIRDESFEQSLLGVRRAQIQLACEFLARGDEVLAQRIANDLRGEPTARLERIAAALQEEERPLFWELTERGINFAYLEPELRPQLAVLLQLVAQAQAR